MISTAITFLDPDVEISQATRHDDCVAVTVKDQDGHRVELYLHEDVWSLIYEAFLDAPQYQRPEAAPAEAEPEPEPEVGDVVRWAPETKPERVLATDLKVGDTIRWEVQAERIDPADGRVYMATTAEFTGTVLHITDDGLDYLDVRIDAGDGEEVRPFIRRTALVQVVGRKAVA